MRINKLDGLRGVFSLMVVLYHYPSDFLPSWFYNNFLIRESYVFVDFFFVLSGFVISYNYNSLDTFHSFLNFFKKRLIRLYPLHFYSNVLFLLYIIFTKTLLIKYFPDLFESNNFSFKYYFQSFIDSVFLTNSTPILGQTLGINGPSWSISSEIISYLVFGVGLIFLPKKIRGNIYFLIIIISSIICYVYGRFFGGEIIGFLRGFVGFFLGYFVYKIYSLKKFSLNCSLEILIPFLLLLILFVLNKLNTTGNGLIFGMITIPLFFSSSILFLLKTNGLLTRLLETRVFQFLGKVSFSVYLNHSILLIVILKSIYKIFKINKTDLNMICVLMIYLTILLLYSYLTCYFIEEKFGKFLKNRFLNN